MKILQLLVGQMSVFAYIIGCEKTGEALVIDPAGNEDQIVQAAEKEGLKIVKIVDTHGHPDHTCGNTRVKELTGAKVVVHEDDAAGMTSPHAQEFAAMLGCGQVGPPDEKVSDGDIIKVGEEVELKVIHTPGHTPGCMCLYTDGNVFTGDTLFVGGVGRTDLPGGSWPVMLDSIQNRILTLPDDTTVWPGHHYGSQPHSTVKKERETNPYLR